MTLTNAYCVSVGRIPDLFSQIKDGQAPERVTQSLLKDWGFTSTNDRSFIPLLKALNFLTSDGKPTSRYNEYRDHSRSRQVLGEALREAYSDIFLIKSNPKESDKKAVEGKFKSFHNATDNVAKLMTRTFYSLLALADITGVKSSEKSIPKPETESPKEAADKPAAIEKFGAPPGLHYNIQIHLPPTKDIEVYNAIFKSLRMHLIDE